MRAEPIWSALPERAQPPPSAAERAQAIARLEAWARARGARFEALELVVDAAGNCSARARRAIAAGEPVVVMPRALVLSDGDLATTATGEPVPFGDAWRSPRDTLAVWLALESEQPDSPWRPFLDVLPAAFPDMPVYRGDDALAPLAGTAARLLAAEAHHDIVETYARLAADVRARVGLAGYAWGRANVRSRGFNAPYTTAPRLAFIPIVDLMDHSPGDTTWRYDTAASEYVVSACRGFAPGEPVHFEYGAYSNTHLLVEYGFAFDTNSVHEAVLVVGDEPFLVDGGIDARLLDLRERVGLVELAAAAETALARLEVAAPAPVQDGAWARMCAAVRRSERAAVESILAWIAHERGQAI
ncbi:MAG TPA: SET domain-containing protein [Kofleriaceae bacterium]|nr:SET domain-containing protein [Kofleriaceae bacterium]